MNNIKVLDCTLRDGGYCNNWQFGQKNIRKILKSLVDSNIDIIECGFLTNKVDYDVDVSKFTDLFQIESFLPDNHMEKLHVVMVNYGEFDFSKLPDCKDVPIDGIRLAFHKKNVHEALEACKVIAEKGYKVFIQPMVSLRYTDNEFLNLINEANRINPYAFYIVDSFGEMKRKDLTRLFYMVEHNLNDTIQIGFHSHNNMQLAYSNAQRLVELQTTRNLIIDSSVYGMGRGAGNLNTELFTEYLNECRETEYDIKPLLNIIDDVLDGFYQQKKWGYSLPNYISALHSAHPNYAFYLDDKKTLTVESMNEIFLRMDESKKYEYDKEYIEELYTAFMATGREQEVHKDELKRNLTGKTVLLIGPGKSAEIEKEKIIAYLKDSKSVSVSVNYDYPCFETDFAFISNMRRFREYPSEKHNRCIITSNILADDVYLQTKYQELLNDVEAVRDNAGLMAIKFLMNYGVKKIVLAGFDGYSHNSTENYAEKTMALVTKTALLDAINHGMGMVLKEYSKQVEIIFLTKPVYYE